MKKKSVKIFVSFISQIDFIWEIKLTNIFSFKIIGEHGQIKNKNKNSFFFIN